MKEKKVDSLMVLQLFFAILVLLIGIYSKVTENNNVVPIMLLLLSVMFLIVGFREYRKTKNKVWSIFIWCIALFILYSTV